MMAIERLCEGLRPRASGLARWGIIAATLVAAILGSVYPPPAAAQSPECVAPSDVPNDVALKWCRASKWNGSAEAYAGIAVDLVAAGRHCEALRLAERGAELGSSYAHVNVGYIKQNGDCGSRDLPAAISAFESALKLRSPIAGSQLRQVYQGSGPWREYRDPAKAMMWGWANYLLFAPPHDDEERASGRRLGLTETEIDGARERMRRWLVDHKVHLEPRRWLCTPLDGKVPAECLR